MREWDVNLPSKEATMSNSFPYRRYVVVQIRTYKWYGAGPCWHDRCATAAEGFRSLEARIAGEYLDSGMRPQIALVDCREGRVLAASLPDVFLPSLVDWASRYAVQPAAEVPAESATTGREVPDAPDDSAEGEELEEEPEELERQRLVDAVVASFLAGAIDQELLSELEEKLEEDGDFYGADAHCAVSRSTLAVWLAGVLEAGEYRDILGMSDREPVGTEHLLRLLVDHGLPALLEDADRNDAFAPVAISDSAGRRVVLVSSVRGYSFSGIEVAWHGVHSSWQSFLDSLRGQWFSSAEEILQLSEEEQLALIDSAMDM